MSLGAITLSTDLQEQLRKFVKKHDMSQQYQAYDWGNDNYRRGFPEILKLENQLHSTAQNNCLTYADILAVATWGRLRNIKRIKLQSEPIKVTLYESQGIVDSIVYQNPIAPLLQLDKQITGLGPTYLSKLLRFALPAEYGAIDTRIVRTFGEGDVSTKRHAWLKLRVRNDGYGWYISKTQSLWHKEFAKWINILRFLAQLLNHPDHSAPCPHPSSFVTAKLRTPHLWVCADIEMALFSYASSHIS